MSDLRASADSLRMSLRDRRLIPVIGPDLLVVQTVDEHGEPLTAPFYQLVAEKLLISHGLPLTLADTAEGAWVLHRAIAAVLSQGRTNQTPVNPARLRRSIAATVDDLSAQVQPGPALQALAQLAVFDLYVCLTPDDLLSRCLESALGDAAVRVNSYAPRADSSVEVDIPPRQPGQVRVYHPLGRCSNAVEFAIHEEDALEYFYRFRDEGERRARGLLTELRTRDLLFLGCSLPDWLGRGLLRLANDQRLSATDRETMEFFGTPARDAGLNAFLSSFSTNSVIFPWAPEEFVSEIVAMAGHLPNPNAAKPAARPAGAGNAGAARAPSVFVSYASEDSAAARRIAEGLPGLGFGEVWFDRKKLVGGDDWSDRIHEAIESCDFFIPVLSRQADQRRQGVFWEEWRRAITRSLRINDAFLLPLGIDAEPPSRLRYERIPNGMTRGFFDLQILHAQDGRLSPEVCDGLRQRAKAFAGK